VRASSGTLARVAGRVVGSAYRLGELLGHGGMGEVYAAVGPSGESVALKFLRPKHAQSAELVGRFRREAKIAAQIVSPHVARVLGAGKDRDGSLWIAFERLRGETLEQRLRRPPGLALGDMAWIVAHVLEGLRAAHAAGVVHRDIKPGNVFLEAGVAHARVLDFGVSKLLQPEPSASVGVTTTHQGLGTPGYMAPEQLVHAADVDARADLYSAGLLAFVGLTGQLPFAGSTTEGMLHHKLYRDAQSLADVTAFVWPVEIERYLSRALARPRERRHASAAEALAEWQAACRAALARGWVAPEPVASVSDRRSRTKPA
jgi:serine/threonine protein kinase